MVCDIYQGKTEEIFILNNNLELNATKDSILHLIRTNWIMIVALHCQCKQPVDNSSARKLCRDEKFGKLFSQ